MNYLNIPYKITNVPKLDTDFIPFGVWRKSFLAEADRPFSITVEREGGKITVAVHPLSALLSSMREKIMG